MVAVDESVKTFARRKLKEGGKMYTLDRVWREYEGRTVRPVERERFRWYLEQSLPEGATTEAGARGVYVDGVEFRI